MNIRLVMRTKAALFFTFLFPIIFLFVYAGIFARGHPEAVVYMFGPVVTLNIMGSGFFGLGMQSVMQRERGSLRRYRLAPIGAGSMVFSSLLANYLLELPTIALLVLCAKVFFHMPLKIDLFTLLALVTVGTFAFAGFGLTIASVSNTMQEAQVFNNVIWFTLLFLSGVTVPLPMLPAWVQRFAVFLPATYLVTSFQAIMVRGQSIFEHGAEILVLLVSGTFGMLFAWKLFRWEKEEKISGRAKLLSITFIIPFIVMGVGMNMRGNLAAAWEETFSMMSRPPLERPQEGPHDGDLLQGFESSQEAENLLRTWQISAAGSAAGNSYGEMDVISPGSAGTAQALRFKGHLGPAPGAVGGYVSARYAFTLPQRDRSPRGIQFDVRGDNHQIQITVEPTRSSTAAARINFVPDANWQTLRLPVEWLANSSGSPSVPKTWVFEVMVQGAPGDFKFDLDELRVY
jgi:ABC-2 type transport system permease protein